jgi:hypothetical protein
VVDRACRLLVTGDKPAFQLILTGFRLIQSPSANFNTDMANYSLSDHFASFFKNLNPSPSFESTASSQYNTIKGLIEDPAGAARDLHPICFLQGSYKQQTAIYSINDVDIVALCHLWYPSSGAGRSFGRDEIFQIIAAPLMNDLRYRAKVRFGATSMCIKVDLGIRVEILPVVFKMGNSNPAYEPFVLYRPSTRTWEDGFARYHQAYLSHKNRAERTVGNFIPSIKVLKHLRSKNNLVAVSFHIECLLYSLADRIFWGSPADYIPAMLAEIAGTDASSWYSRVIRTPCGDRDIFTSSEWNLAAWNAFHASVQRWSLLAVAARDASTKSETIRLWRILLGNAYFPETA